MPCCGDCQNRNDQGACACGSVELTANGNWILPLVEEGQPPCKSYTEMNG